MVPVTPLPLKDMELCSFTPTIADSWECPMTTITDVRLWQEPLQTAKYYAHHQRAIKYHSHHCSYLNTTTPPPPPPRSGNTVTTITVMWIPLATLQWYVSTMITTITELSECHIQSHSCALPGLKLQSHVDTTSTNTQSYISTMVIITELQGEHAWLCSNMRPPHHNCSCVNTCTTTTTDLCRHHRHHKYPPRHHCNYLNTPPTASHIYGKMVIFIDEVCEYCHQYHSYMTTTNSLTEMRIPFMQRPHQPWKIVWTPWTPFLTYLKATIDFAEW